MIRLIMKYIFIVKLFEDIDVDTIFYELGQTWLEYIMDSFISMKLLSSLFVNTFHIQCSWNSHKNLRMA